MKPIRHHRLGFAGMYMDDMERREDVPRRWRSASSPRTTWPFRWGSRVMSFLAVGGAMVKPVYEKIDERSASGFAFDLGSIT